MLDELDRLLALHRAYDVMNAGDAAMATGDFEAAVGHYSRATAMAPDIVELPFWQAATLFVEGREDEALPIFRRVFAAEPRWVEVVRRLPAAGLRPDAAAVERILTVAPGAPDATTTPESPR
jgi:tetratricopeptide (TPR) repeat protein